MSAYYNEIDRKAAAWLRELIKRGLIAPGEVDERDIRDIKPSELKGFTQCHFFAGIGGWSYALRLAGWPDDRPVWTGSCPCQPFSQVGKRKGASDERHLWPDFYWLIQKCRPAIVFGEQVARKHGFNWLAGVRVDLENAGYTVGAADLCAAGVQAPHLRQRLYWVADSATGDCAEKQVPSSWGSNGSVSNASRTSSATIDMVNTASTGFKEQWREHCAGGEGDSRLIGFAMQASVPPWNGPTIAIRCSDGPRRASAEPGAFPLAYGVPDRVVKLRGSGNAIVPQVAAAFIEASMSLIAVAALQEDGKCNKQKEIIR